MQQMHYKIRKLRNDHNTSPGTHSEHAVRRKKLAAAWARNAGHLCAGVVWAVEGIPISPMTRCAIQGAVALLMLLCLPRGLRAGARPAEPSV